MTQVIDKTNSQEKREQVLNTWKLLWTRDPGAPLLKTLPLSFQKAYNLQIEYFGDTPENTNETRARGLFFSLLKIYERALSFGPSLMKHSLMQRSHDPTFFKLSHPEQKEQIEWWLDAFDWLEDRGIRLSMTNRRSWLDKVLKDRDLEGEKSGIH